MTDMIEEEQQITTESIRIPSPVTVLDTHTHQQHHATETKHSSPMEYKVPTSAADIPHDGYEDDLAADMGAWDDWD